MFISVTQMQLAIYSDLLRFSATFCELLRFLGDQKKSSVKAQIRLALRPNVGLLR